jgi:phage terminase large subunit GpA-like protein
MYNYEDVKCPHCGKIERIQFTVKHIPFGETTIVSEGVRQCFHCKEYYMPTVQIIYDARKLHSFELKNINKSTTLL